MITKYDLDDTVLVHPYGCYDIQKGIVSMITINRKGIRYRVKVECEYTNGICERTKFDRQIDVWEDQIIGKEDESND